MATVAPAGPTVSGDLITANRLVGDPVLVQRLLLTLVNQRLIGKRALKGRLDLTGSGSALFELAESIYATESAERIADNADYPLTDDTRGTLSPVNMDKWALGTEISDVLVARNRVDVITRKFLKLANRIAKGFDTLCLSAIATAVTQTQAVTAGVWSGGTADPFADILMGGSVVDTLDQGFEVDTVIARPAQWAQLVSRAKVLDYLPREGGSPVVTGRMITIAGLEVWKTTNMPAGVDVMLIDSRMLGTIAYEDQGGNYNGSADDVQTKLFRREGNDGVRLQARLVNVPVVQEAGAAVKLTGVTS